MIEVHQLTKRFPLPGGGELTAVDGLSFSVPAGEVYGLLGPNGAGKTTTLRMLLGLLRPTEGHAAIAGFHSNEFPDEVKRRVGLVSANTGLYQWLTAREMLLFFADLYGVPQDEARQRLSKLSGLLGLTEYLDRRCATLSTGQSQRVNLARALIHDPPVVLLDEPTLGLDVIGSQVINEYVEHLRDKGHAVIVCTHRLDEAERLCNRFGLLHRGRIVSEGTLAELRERIGCQTLVEMFIRVSQIGRVLAAHPAEAGE
jgi:sodium transport system ATP-binding protein